MSNGCNNSGVGICSRVWSEWKPSFHIFSHWENRMIVFSSNVCSIYTRYLDVYPNSIVLEYPENDTDFASIHSNTDWVLSPSADTQG